MAWWPGQRLIRNLSLELETPGRPVMDMDPVAATRPAADPAGTAVAGDHPQAQTAKVSLVSHLPGVTGGAEAFFELSFPAAARTPLSFFPNE